MKDSCDVCVVGGGVIGLACAWRLAKCGFSIVLLDQGQVGSGTSARSIGVLAPPSPLGKSSWVVLHRRSLSMVNRYFAELEDESGGSVDFANCGGIEIISSESQYLHACKEVEIVRQRQNEIGWSGAFELLSLKETQELEPGVKVTEFGALYNPRTSRVSVSGVLFSLRKAAESRGVKMIDYTKVLQLNQSKDRSWRIDCKKGAFYSDKVLVCAGVWTPFLHPQLNNYAKVHPVRGQALEVLGGQKLVSHVLKYDKRYIVPLKDNSYLLGSTTEKDAGYLMEPTKAGRQSIFNTLVKVVPTLAGTEIVNSWAGLRPAGEDSRPIIGQIPECEGLYVATGHYKIGFAHQPLTAQAITELICGSVLSIDLKDLQPRRVN